MKKDSSAVRLETAAASAPQLEAVPSSPDMSLGSEILGALQRFEQKKSKLEQMQQTVEQNLPQGEDQAELARYNSAKSDLIEWSKVMLRQLPELKELEYMSTDKTALKRIKKATDFLEGLKTEYQDIESPEAVKVRKIRSEESTGVQIRNREQIELKDQEEKARKATAVMRRELANLKRSFYKIYGMTLDEALVAPSSVIKHEEEKQKGFWNKLASQIWEKPKSEEEKKLDAVKSKTAKADIKRIQELNKKIESTWNQVMGQYASEVEPQTSISMDTLRDVLKQEMPDKTDKQINDSAFRIIKTLRIALPEEIREVEKNVDLEGVHELKPARKEKPEPPVVIKEEVQEKKPQKEIPTLKLVKEEEVVEPKEAKAEVQEVQEVKDRKQTAIEIMEIFGGGEQARQRGSNLFEAVKNQMSLMKIEDMDPLDYVYLVAQRTKAENENNKKAAADFDKQIKGLNKKLNFGTTDPSKGINMGASRLMEARALGSTPARAEAARMAEQISGMPAVKKAESTKAEPGIATEEVKEPKTLRKKPSLRLVKPEPEKPIEVKPQTDVIAPPEEELQKGAEFKKRFEKGLELKEKLEKPMDLSLAAHYVPNARLAWDMFDKELPKNSAAVAKINKLIKSQNIPDSTNPTTNLVFVLGEEQRIREEYLNKRGLEVDEKTTNDLLEKHSKLSDAIDKIGEDLGINILNKGGLIDKRAWDPDNMTENEIDAKYAAAQEEIPNYNGFQRALHEQVGADYETLIGKKYFAAVENYIQEVKRGDPDRIKYAENAWKALDEGLGIEHDTLKDLLYSEPVQNSPMGRISKRNARSSARDKSWRP